MTLLKSLQEFFFFEKNLSDFLFSLMCKLFLTRGISIEFLFTSTASCSNNKKGCMQNIFNS